MEHRLESSMEAAGNTYPHDDSSQEGDELQDHSVACDEESLQSGGLHGNPIDLSGYVLDNSGPYRYFTAESETTEDYEGYLREAISEAMLASDDTEGYALADDNEEDGEVGEEEGEGGEDDQEEECQEEDDDYNEYVETYGQEGSLLLDDDETEGNRSRGAGTLRYERLSLREEPNGLSPVLRGVMDTPFDPVFRSNEYGNMVVGNHRMKPYSPFARFVTEKLEKGRLLERWGPTVWDPASDIISMVARRTHYESEEKGHEDVLAKLVDLVSIEDLQREFPKNGTPKTDEWIFYWLLLDIHEAYLKASESPLFGILQNSVLPMKQEMYQSIPSTTLALIVRAIREALTYIDQDSRPACTEIFVTMETCKEYEKSCLKIRRDLANITAGLTMQDLCC